jgi:hypothetical protein
MRKIPIVTATTRAAMLRIKEKTSKLNLGTVVGLAD